MLENSWLATELDRYSLLALKSRMLIKLQIVEARLIKFHICTKSLLEIALETMHISFWQHIFEILLMS